MLRTFQMALVCVVNFRWSLSTAGGKVWPYFHHEKKEEILVIVKRALGPRLCNDQELVQ